MAKNRKSSGGPAVKRAPLNPSGTGARPAGSPPPLPGKASGAKVRGIALAKGVGRGGAGSNG